jgi:hypothetical protein
MRVKQTSLFFIDTGEFYNYKKEYKLLIDSEVTNKHPCYKHGIDYHRGFLDDNNYSCNKHYVKCDYCDSVVEKRNTLKAYGVYVCSYSCFDKCFKRCSEHKYVLKIDDSYELDGKYYCEECYNEKTFACEDCNTVYSNDECNSINDDKYVCNRCFDNYVTCDGCSVVIHIDNSYNIQDQTYCGSCSESYSYCERCEEYYYVEEYSRCPNCTSELINSSDYKPDPVFYTGKTEQNKSNTLFLGFELEIDKSGKSEECVEKLIETFNDFLYCKEDGSLRNGGFEIVSHPFSQKWFDENKKKLIKILKISRRFGFRSLKTSTCGLHIHVNSSSFDKTNLFKVLKLIYDNKNFFCLFSQRKQDFLYCGFDYERLFYNEKAIVCKKKIKYTESKSRYSAVNLSNSETIEFRFFKGTLSKLGFFRALEFVFFLHEFVNDIELKNVTIDWFITKLFYKSNKYRNLWRHASAVYERLNKKKKENK